MYKESNIAIYVMAHNRPNYITTAIDSILNQSMKSFTCIISDNSTNDSIENVYQIKYRNNPQVIYIKQNNLDPIDHINKIIELNDYDYFMIFHDDDSMMPDMLEHLYGICKKYGCVAVGCNANIIRGGKNKGRYFSDKSDVWFNSPKEIAVRYLNNKIAPFPSFLYNKRMVGKMRLHKEFGGKYCDSSFICSLANCGPVVYINKTMMNYNIHNGQDTASHEYYQYNSLITYYKQLGITKYLIQKAKVYNLYCEFVRRHNRYRHKYHLRYVFLFFKRNKTIAIKYLLRLILSLG